MFLCVWTGNKGVEILDLVMGLSVLGVLSAIILYGITKISSPKKAKSKGDNSISDLYDVYNTQVKDILKIKDTQISSLTSKLKRMEADQIEIEPESNEDQKFEEITALVKTQFPQYAPLMILAKKQIMEATKGMDMKEILGYVKQFTQSKGSKGAPDPQSVEFNPTWA